MDGRLGGGEVVDEVDQAPVMGEPRPPAPRPAAREFVDLVCCLDLGRDAGFVGHPLGGVETALCDLRHPSSSERDPQSPVEVGHLAQAGWRSCRSLYFWVHSKMSVLAQNVMAVAAIGGLSGSGSAMARAASGSPRWKGLEVKRTPLAVDLDRQLLRQRVDHRCPDTVQATGDLVAATAELPTRVQDGEDQRDRGNALGGVDVEQGCRGRCPTTPLTPPSASSLRSTCGRRYSAIASSTALSTDSRQVGGVPVRRWSRCTSPAACVRRPAPPERDRAGVVLRQVALDTWG